MKTTHLTSGGYVETWYNRDERAWVTQHKDREGNQQGDADYCGDKARAMAHHQWLVAKLANRGPETFSPHCNLKVP